MPWSVKGTKGSFVPLAQRESAKQRLTEQKECGRPNVYELSESVTNKSSSDSSTEQEKGLGRGEFDSSARRFSVPLIIRRGSMQSMPVHMQEGTGRLVKDMI